MKKRTILMALLVIILASTVVAILSCSLFENKVEGTIVGEVFMLYKEYVYIKPVGDQGTKQLLEFQILSDSSFASGHSYDDFENAPELVVGTVVEIDYTYDPDIAKTSIDSIKVTNGDSASIEWPELEINKDYSYTDNNVGTWNIGEVEYVVKLNSPMKGYIVYLDEGSNKLGDYWIDADHKFLVEHWRELFEKGSTGYIIKMTRLDKSQFKGLSTAFSFETVE